MGFKGNKITELLDRNNKVISIEVTPDVANDELKAIIDPVFISITWHARSYPCPDLAIPPLRLAARLREEGREVLLHLSCDQLKKDYLDSVLEYLQGKNICNLFVILGDGFNPSGSDFKSTTELIVYIRNKTGDYFCIGVAGYPDDFSKMAALEAKVKSGANFIITQAFFEYHIYEKFLHACRDWVIAVPIIPGIFLFETHEELTRFADICEVKISQSFLNFIKSTSESKVPGLLIMEKLMADIIKNGNLSGNMHIFTLNKLQSIYRILDQFTLKFKK